jgi:hypothetical protein
MLYKLSREITIFRAVWQPILPTSSWKLLSHFVNIGLHVTFQSMSDSSQHNELAMGCRICKRSISSPKYPHKLHHPHILLFNWYHRPYSWEWAGHSPDTCSAYGNLSKITSVAHGRATNTQTYQRSTDGNLRKSHIPPPFFILLYRVHIAVTYVSCVAFIQITFTS